MLKYHAHLMFSLYINKNTLLTFQINTKEKENREEKNIHIK